MTTPLAAPAGEHLLEVQARYRYSAFRLETRQSYAGSGEDDALNAFRSGRPQPPLDAEDLRYLDAVRAARLRGAHWQRVHVVTEPLSDYLRYELTWEYGPNADAGEEIGIVAVKHEEAWPHDLAGVDFWLFDSSVLFELTYDHDDRWLDITEVTDPDRIVAACRRRDAALHHARSWRDYLASHPDLGRQVPTMREAS